MRVKGTCYYLCGRQADHEQGGKSVCSECSLHYALGGQSYPLRDPRWRNVPEGTMAIQMQMRVPWGAFLDR